MSAPVTFAKSRRKRYTACGDLEGVETLDAHFKKPIARQNKQYLLFSLLVFITF